MLIQDSDEKTYYEDPILSFEDSTIYGCSLELTLEELRDFCRKNLYEHLMLFQNLFLLDKVGKTGNADQHYIKDWLQIEIDTNKDIFGTQKAELSTDQDSCEFPSTRVVEIFYKRINTDKEPQYVIMKMQHYSPENL